MRGMATEKTPTRASPGGGGPYLRSICATACMPSSPGGASRLERNRITPYGKWLRPIPPGVEGNIEIEVRGTHLVPPQTTHPHGGLGEANIL